MVKVPPFGRLAALLVKNFIQPPKTLKLRRKVQRKPKLHEIQLLQ